MPYVVAYVAIVFLCALATNLVPDLARLHNTGVRTTPRVTTPLAPVAPVAPPMPRADGEPDPVVPVMPDAD